MQRHYSRSTAVFIAIQSEEDPEMVTWKTLPDVIELVKEEWKKKGN